jgi:LysM repeat protein
LARHFLTAPRYRRRTARLGVVLVLGAALATTAVASPASAGTVHVVKRGESLASIAQGAGLDSWRPIWDANRGISHPDLIHPGQRLAVPAKGDKVKHRPLPSRLRPVVLASATTSRSYRSDRVRVRSDRTRVRSDRARVTRSSAIGNSVWDRLAQCESGGNWGINTGNGYSGGLQFTASTWRAAGGSGSAHNASRAEQIRVAKRVQQQQGWGAWPACSRRLGLR